MRTRYVYAVMVPEDTGLDGLYSTASGAIARLREYGDVSRGAVGKLARGEIVYLDPDGDESTTETHAVRVPVHRA